MQSEDSICVGMPIHQNNHVKRKAIGSLGSQLKNKNKKRTKEDFLDFCQAVLKYTKYEPEEKQDLSKGNDSPMHSPESDSTFDSYLAEHIMPNSMPPSRDEEAVTCFCNKPFAGRPMIECGSCSTWIHLSCAKIRRTNIPEEFVCPRCRGAAESARKSSRIRTENKRLKDM